MAWRDVANSSHVYFVHCSGQTRSSLAARFAQRSTGCTGWIVPNARCRILSCGESWSHLWNMWVSSTFILMFYVSLLLRCTWCNSRYESQPETSSEHYFSYTETTETVIVDDRNDDFWPFTLPVYCHIPFRPSRPAVGPRRPPFQRVPLAP